METEIEATFTDIDVGETRTKLRDIGATLVQPEILMRRKVYDHPTNITAYNVPTSLGRCVSEYTPARLSLVVINKTIGFEFETKETK